MTYCVFNTSAGYLYLNNPKAACSSIKLAIAKHLGLEYEELIRRSKPHSVILARRKPNLFSFSVIRNPYDRLVSLWADMLNGPQKDDALNQNRTLQQWKDVSFDEFVRGVVKIPDKYMNPHVMPQHRLIGCTHGVRANWLILFEHLGNSWPVLQHMFGLPGLPHERKSEHWPWEEYYTPQLMQLVAKKYRQDFELGGWPT